MLEILKAIIYGIVQGITEWLPVSSTGHMIILQDFIPFTVDHPLEFWSLFEVVVQLGSIIAVIILFWNKIFPFRIKKTPHIKKKSISLWLKIIVATLPLIPGMLIKKAIGHFFSPYPFDSSISVAIALIIFGIAFILIENYNKNRAPTVTKLSDLSYRFAIYIGLFQLLAAIFPGVSRSGATIVGALLIGVSRTVAAEFTFTLAIPAMIGASVFEIFSYDFALTGIEIGILLAGTVVAFVVSLFAIRFLMNFVKKHDFKVFGWYRIVLGAIVLIYGIIKIAIA